MSTAQNSGRTQILDPPQGFEIYTTGVLESRIGGFYFLDPFRDVGDVDVLQTHALLLQVPNLERYQRELRSKFMVDQKAWILYKDFNRVHNILHT